MIRCCTCVHTFPSPNPLWNSPPIESYLKRRPKAYLFGGAAALAIGVRSPRQINRSQSRKRCRISKWHNAASSRMDGWLDGWMDGLRADLWIGRQGIRLIGWPVGHPDRYCNTREIRAEEQKVPPFVAIATFFTPPPASRCVPPPLKPNLNRNLYLYLHVDEHLCISASRRSTVCVCPEMR